jgi:peptidoglycan LD-endopeptidase LytH
MNSEPGTGPVSARGRLRVAAVFAAALALGLFVAGRPAAVGSTPASSGDAAPALGSWRAYVDSLGSASARLLRDWDAMADSAVLRAATVRPPYAERGRFAGRGPEAVGYRVDLLRGERLTVAVDVEEGAHAPFVELVADPGLHTAAVGMLEHTAQADGTVQVRVRPRVGSRMPYTLRIDRSAALTFPVPAAQGAVLSYFRDPRAGGERLHEGIDIGAPRNSPVVAAAPGVVERVGNGGAGGRVVWVREDGTGRSHYYAHLETQLVREGARVAAGDPIGTVGTSGNAHATTPHLHFGIYASRRALDPLDFLDGPDPAARYADDADPDLIGSRVRTRFAGAAFRTVNRMYAPAQPLARHAELEVLAVAGRYYRVRSAASDADGFLASWLLEPVQSSPVTRVGSFRR